MLSTADRARIDARLRQILRDNDKLDSALYILEKSFARYQLDVNDYTGQLNSVIRGALSPAQVSADVEAAIQAFYKNLKQYLTPEFIAGRTANRVALEQAVLENYGATIDTVTRGMAQKLTARASQFKLSAELLKVPERIAATAAARELDTVTVGNQLYYKQPLENIWREMVGRYGRYDTVTYLNGAHHPLRSYVDGRIITTEAETDRFVTEAETAASGVLFLRIPANGTTDSCVFHENRLLIASEAARAQAIERWPEHAATFAAMLTPAQIRADGTHMFKHACRHKLVPDQVQFKSSARQQATFEAFKPAKVPEKISERKIFESITGEKFEPAVPSKKKEVTLK